jgi:hypothetical protein
VIDSTKLSEADVLAQVQELAAQRLRR